MGFRLTVEQKVASVLAAIAVFTSGCVKDNTDYIAIQEFSARNYDTGNNCTIHQGETFQTGDLKIIANDATVMEIQGINCDGAIPPEVLERYIAELKK